MEEKCGRSGSKQQRPPSCPNRALVPGKLSWVVRERSCEEIKGGAVSLRPLLDQQNQCPTGAAHPELGLAPKVKTVTGKSRL